MAEGFDLYHVPQQRRRDKLRLSNLQLQGLLPIYDPSSVFSSDYMTGGLESRCSGDEDRGGVCTGVKDEGGNYMANYVVGGNNSYMMDPRSSSIQLNPTSIQEIEHNPFLYNPQSFRFYNACSQGLSLSLSSNHTQQSTLPLELNNNHQNYEHDSTIYSGKMGSFVTRNSSTVHDLSRSSVPLGPFTGYASVLKGSRFLGPAQQLLEEICDVGEGNYPEKLSADTVMLDPLMEKSTVDDDNSPSCNLGSDQRRKKSRLMLLLDEVYKRYKQYCHQMQAVVASFESVSGVKNAAPFTSMAVKSMSKHFNFLRNAISDQLQHFLTEPHNNNHHHHVVAKENNHHHHHVVAKEKEHIVVPGFDTSSSVNGMFDFVQHQPVWRPQRGLPECAVTVLRAWLFDHFLHPYPTDTDKLMLAKQTGLSRNQVSNWFINARVRLWKPMVEEIHMLESKQAQKSSQDQTINNVNDSENNQTIPTPRNIPMITSTTVQRIDDNNTMPLKRARINESTMAPTAEKNALMDRNYENISSFPQMGFGVSSGSTTGSVSLTLGLQQNNGGSRLTDPFSLSAARRLGLVDPNGEEYLPGGWH